MAKQKLKSFFKPKSTSHALAFLVEEYGKSKDQNNSSDIPRKKCHLFGPSGGPYVEAE